MKIALIGSNGLLGSALKKELSSKNYNVLLLTHDNFDISNITHYSILIENNIDFVINTAAYLGVEPCEQNPLKAFEINTFSVGLLSRFCNTNKITLIHISTDAVFDGKSGQYNEIISPEPINYYGLTKYNGEQLVKMLCEKYYIFRLPILFGNRENKGNTFIEKMYNLYLNGTKEFKIADDIISNPSYSNDVAESIINLIEKKYEYGIYHIFNSGGENSLYDFASEFFNSKEIYDIKIHRAKAKDFSINELGKKPLNTSLISSKISPLRNWKEALKEYCKESVVYK